MGIAKVINSPHLYKYLVFAICMVTTGQIVGGTTLCYKHFLLQTGLRILGLVRRLLITYVNN